MTGVVLTLAMVFGTNPLPYPSVDPVGVATWYGGGGACVQGYARTCSPYLPKSKGGRGGELVLYAATGEFANYYNRPLRAEVCRLGTRKCVEVVIRDRCTACLRDGKGGRVIDLSPVAFSELAPLYRGVIRVSVTPLYEGVGR